MLPYPFSYFSSIFSPQKMFANRKQMNLWQRLFTTLFLIGLLALPSSFQIMKLDTYPLETFVEGVYEPLTESVVEELSQHASINNRQFDYTGKLNWERVTFGDTVSSSSDFSYQFKSQSFIIRKGNTILSELTYDNMTTSDFSNKEKLTTAISKKWYQSNQAVVGLSILAISLFSLTANLLFILCGASFFLFLTKTSRFFHFKTFSECYTFSLNCLGLPTIVACLIGLFGQPITTIFTVQNILFVLCLLWVFFKTKFRDTI